VAGALEDLACAAACARHRALKDDAAVDLYRRNVELAAETSLALATADLISLAIGSLRAWASIAKVKRVLGDLPRTKVGNKAHLAGRLAVVFKFCS
jgi:hypothetical protein